jgi:hypothetical protein
MSSLPYSNYTVILKRHDGSTLYTVRPENLRFTFNLDAPHDISFELSLDRPMMEDNNTDEIGGGPLGAYQHDWVLQRNGETLPGMAGIITSLSLTDANEALSITGKSWLHYLERRHFPYDPKNINPPPGPNAEIIPPRPEIIFIAFQQDMSDIIHDMIAAVIARPYSLDIDLTHIGGGDTFKYNYEIDFGDSETIQSKLATLAEGKAPYCFDYSIDEHKVFRMYHPEYSDPHTLSWRLRVALPATDKYSSSLIRGETSWTDSGPAGTHVVATGSSLQRRTDPINPSDQTGFARGSIDGQKTFRRLDFTQDFGEQPNDNRALQLTDGALRAGVRPQREVPIKVVIQDIPNFFTKFHVGNYFEAIVPLGAHTITGTKKITSVEVEVTNEGDETALIHSTLWKAWYDVDSVVGQL